MKFKWLAIIIGLLIGLLIPQLYCLAVGVVILTGYKLCNSAQKPGFQLFLAYLFGGLVMGAVIKIILYYGMSNQVVPLIIAPILTGLFTRSLFLYFEEHYSLIRPNREKLNLSPEPNLESESYPEADTRKGFSAWGGESSGGSSIPDETGARIIWNFVSTGEIAMGGPTYGDVVFSNNYAFTGVGPSIVISDDGQYAAMTLPSRNQWGLLIADLKNKRAYEPRGNSGLWEIDCIANNTIHGRHSPLVSNAKLSVSISKAIQQSNELPMVNDDGWWVIDYEGRKPFPQYEAITIYSSNKTHRVTFVPDLAPFKLNPFTRYRHPFYSVLVDDFLLTNREDYPHAVWINGKKESEEGRYLVFSSQVIDCFDPIKNQFNIKAATLLKAPSWNGNTHVQMGDYADGGNGILLAKGTVLTRSTGFNEAEYSSKSVTNPWDDEEVTYWDLTGKKHLQKRTRIERHIRYEIDLTEYAFDQLLPLSSTMELVNRANPAYTAKLMRPTVFDKDTPYAGYPCVTSRGIDVGLIIEEAIWSHCGRYLAVVAYAPKPDVPHKIKIIDFNDASVRELPGRYALPSLMWFDEAMLELTHVVAINESAWSINPRREYNNRINLDDPGHKENQYDLLFTSLEKRRAAMDKKARKMQTKNSHCSGSVDLISQHCLLFARNFDLPVLQPPTPQK